MDWLWGVKHKKIKLSRELTRITGWMVLLLTELGERERLRFGEEGESLCSLVAVKASHFSSDWIQVLVDIGPEKAMAPHSSALAWRIPGTGRPGGLPSMGSHRVRHD